MSPSARPATQSEGQCCQVPRLPRKQSRRPQRQLRPKGATRASPGPKVPHLPRKVHVDVTKGHACHAKGTSMSPSARPGTQNARRCRQVPHVPRKAKVNVAKRHACHANSRGVHGVNWDPSAPPEPAQCHKRHACHAKSKLCVDKSCV